mmetsp:Transcript_18689/g.34405  ORF Transcript_18689/g.34405 Transcript_18689/m.34405 type:complete len:623 (+) Transcript_18689:38-1906(+)
MISSYQFGGSALSILYVAFRVSTANLAPITDCDEVFNYWEPLHFVLYGTGMQTWEYAHQYALRTYAYLLPMAAVAKSFQRLLDWLPPSFHGQLSTMLLLSSSDSLSQINELGAQNKPLLFAMLRSFLAFFSCYSELSFLSAIQDVISPTMAHWTAICSLTAAGNFHASQAFLPSSSVMILWRLSVANQLRDNHASSIFWGLVAVLAVGWPFCAVLFLSTGFWAVWKASGLGDSPPKKFQFGSVMQVLLRTALHAVFIQALVVAIDYHFYGQIVSPIWNIFAYNAQSGGDELYGVEPLSYYIKNLLLNFNFVSLLGVVSIPVILLKKMAERFYPETLFGDDHKKCNNSTTSMEILVLVPMYIWMAIVFPRPHKEERFLSPIYPMLCFGASITMRETLRLSNKVFSLLCSKKQTHKSRNNVSLLLGLALLSPSVVISISRSFALHHYYSAPLMIHRKLFSHAAASPVLSGNKITYVCTAGEWYRFPSSFFLPPNHQLGFLKSSFGGQLPQPFTASGSKRESLNAQVGNFNDINKEEMDRYIDIEQCSFVVELVPFESENSRDIPECLQYMKSDSSAGSWTQLASYNYLDTDSTSVLHRILYLPFGRNGKVTYKGYNLYAKDLDN